MTTYATAAPVLSRRLSLPLAEAEVAVRDALKRQGFGILTEIDVKGTLESKLEGVAFRPYRILGACNPRLAYSGLQADARVGSFLPCGVALYEGGTPGETLIAIQDPGLIAEAFGPELAPMATEVRRLLEAALDDLGSTR
jgi:uncharacterized protein (DUF302 family)